MEASTRADIGRIACGWRRELESVGYANALGGGDWHQQWSHKVVFSGKKETSTRARSMVFYGLAVLATSLLTVNRPDVLVPENGFISINPPLLSGRMASLSTRTTHPQFMALLQKLLDAIGVDAQLSMPYRFKTKGEMLAQCTDQALLTGYACDTTSCGRFRTYNRTHCGRCVPCMVRKAAIHRWGLSDTTRYKFSALSGAGKTSADDPMAVACAVLTAEQRGIDSFLGATLTFASDAELAQAWSTSKDDAAIALKSNGLRLIEILNGKVLL